MRGKVFDTVEIKITEKNDNTAVTISQFEALQGKVENVCEGSYRQRLGTIERRYGNQPVMRDLLRQSAKNGMDTLQAVTAVSIAPASAREVSLTIRTRRSRDVLASAIAPILPVGFELNINIVSNPQLTA